MAIQRPIAGLDATTPDIATDATTPSELGPTQADHRGLEWRSAALYRCRLDDAERVNAGIDAAVRRLGEADFDRRSHFVGGRFENLYVERTRLPDIAPVLDQAIACAARILERPIDSLRCGFWLNSTAPGQATSEHTHDEDDELLSAVYYVTVPPDSGNLVLYDGPATIHIEPESGTLVFFPPSLPHAVETNRSQTLRLSIGINIGPR
jgi:hypothetical protein